MRYLLVLVTLLSFTACKKKPEKLEIPDLSDKTVTLSSKDITFATVDDSVAFADGKDMIHLMLKLSESALTRFKTAGFTVASVGNFSDGSKNMTLSVDASGTAHVFVNSDAPGITYVKATVGDLTQSATITFFEASTPFPVDTLVLDTINNNARADNYSYIEVTAKIKDPEVFARMKTVKFTIDKGSFANGQTVYETNIGNDSMARAFIKHNKAELVKVTATLANTYTEQIGIRFTPSYPMQLFVEPAASTILADYTANMNIGAKLLRSPGTVSEGQIVSFKDSSSKGVNAVGAFFNTTTSDGNGQANAKYWIQDTSFRGDLFIIGEVQVPGGTVRGINKIYVTK